MEAIKDGAFLYKFMERLEIGPAWLHQHPSCVVWLDAEQRPNTCCVRPYQAASPLVRVLLNRAVHLPPHVEREQRAWSRPPATRPDWSLELTCLESELARFAPWLAALVNRREGLLRAIPAPPCPLLNWSDLRRLDDYVYYLSAVSFWSEASFTTDLKAHNRRAPLAVPAALGCTVAMVAAQ